PHSPGNPASTPALESVPRFPHIRRTTATNLRHQRRPFQRPCFPRDARTCSHTRVVRRQYHLTHSECRCIRTWELTPNFPLRERTTSIFKFKPSRIVDHVAPRISIRSTSAAAELTMLSGLMTRSRVGVFSIVR